jgi:hypothetical protein
MLPAQILPAQILPAHILPAQTVQARTLQAPALQLRSRSASFMFGLVPLGVQLLEEQRTPLLLVLLPELTRPLAKRIEAAEKSPVTGVAPAHIPRPPPPGRPQCVETPVIAGAGKSVSGDRVLALF